MAHDFKEFRQAAEETLDWLKKEYSSIRTGQATPGILDRISVSAYGSSVPVNQLATISVEDSKTLRIVPWDKDVSKDIDKTIRESNLGLSVALDASGLRVSFPELTGERRAVLSKVVREKFEEARIRIRNEREKSLSQFEKLEKTEGLGEDEKFKFKSALQKQVEEVNQKLEEVAQKKEREILE